MGIAFVLYLLYAIIFVAVNFYEVPLLPASLVVKIFVDYVLLNMCLAAIFVTVSCLLSQQAIIAIVNITFVLLMIIGSQRLYAGLSQPQYYELYETVNSEWIDEEGNIRYREEKIEGSEYLVENPTYVGESGVLFMRRFISFLLTDMLWSLCISTWTGTGMIIL